MFKQRFCLQNNDLQDLDSYAYQRPIDFQPSSENQDRIGDFAKYCPFISNQRGAMEQGSSHLWNSLHQFQRIASPQKNNNVPLPQITENSWPFSDIEQFLVQIEYPQQIHPVEHSKQAILSQFQQDSIPLFQEEQESMAVLLHEGSVKMKECSVKKKNQYDKNIVGNILKMLIKDLFDKRYEKQLLSYCQKFNMGVSEFLGLMSGFKRQRCRMGTTQLYKFLFSGQYPECVKKVFSLFMIRYLNSDYLQYIVREGKMKDKQKYIRYSVQLMYVHNLSPEELAFMRP